MNKKGAAKVPFLFAFDFELSRGFFIEEPFGSDDVLFSLRGKGNKPKEAPFNGKAELIAFPLGYEEYLEKFQVVQKGLMRGDSFLVNLTVKTPIETNLSLYDIFIKSDSLFQLYVPGLFVCFSPEIFVSIENGEIKTYPMKGTIPADIPNAQERILKDPKETAEHATIVDLLRNDLSINADEVKVRRYRYIDKLKTSKMEILQVSSEIVGKLPLGWEGRIGDIIYRMLPAGSCSGAPKESTLRIIRESEGQSRGFYTGIFGLFDGVNMDSAVLIRFIEEDGGQKYFRSGGGITAQSLATDEYQEAIDKIYLPFV
ncbi:MAG: aminodeoxychorismate synthase component I [Deltaproteobacteria bacterium]|nr:aminodeoxychorismate synthase component I [Deltaproteobacteria bacterium]